MAYLAKEKGWRKENAFGKWDENEIKVQYHESKQNSF